MIVLVANEKGGVGKTSVAVNLAAHAAADGVRVLLLDTDPNGSTTGWLKTRASIEPPPSNEIFTMVLTGAAPAKMLVDQAKHYDLVVVDVGAAAWKIMLEVAAIADLCIIPCSPGQYEVDATQRVFAAFEKLNALHVTGKVPAYVLPTMIPTNSRSREEAEFREFLANELSIPLMKSTLRSRKVWRECSKEGLALKELPGRQRDTKAIEEMQAVYEEAARLTQGG